MQVSHAQEPCSMEEPTSLLAMRDATHAENQQVYHILIRRRLKINSARFGGIEWYVAECRRALHDS